MFNCFAYLSMPVTELGGLYLNGVVDVVEVVEVVDVMDDEEDAVNMD